MTGSTPLTPDEKAHAFRRATSLFPERYASEIGKGLTDIELKTALKDYLGIFGGSCGPGEISLCYQGAGLKIWASWEIGNHVIDKPIFQGTATVEMARHIYQIADPANMQMPLF